jgi:hypothetical protein
MACSRDSHIGTRSAKVTDFNTHRRGRSSCRRVLTHLAGVQGRRMSAHDDDSEYDGQSLKHISIDRLSCLLRHWAWADEAKSRFEPELTRLRRLHRAFSVAFRNEQVSREVDSLGH